VASDGVIHLASTLSLRREVVMNTDIRGMGGLLGNWHAGPFIFCSSTDVYGPLQTILRRRPPVAAIQLVWRREGSV